MNRLLLAVPFAALALAACGDGDDTVATPTAGATVTATAAATAAPTIAETASPSPAEPQIEVFDVPAGSHPHDVAPALDGGVWYTAQATGILGWLNPETGEVRETPLGPGSSPHGVIIDDKGVAWVTDTGQNAIVSVHPDTLEVTVYALPADRPNANLNTAAFDGNGVLWFTGQNGVYGSLDPASGDMAVYDAPRGRGPYGITGTPSGDVYYASLAGSYVGRIDITTGNVTVLEPPTPGQGARRVWSDSSGRIWVSEWNSGQVSVYDPAADSWNEWRLPGAAPSAYAVYVDDRDDVWLTDFGGDAIHRFDPETETFETFPLPDVGGSVRQLLGRPGELWAPESAVDKIFVIRY